jgi:hypothetical protein
MRRILFNLELSHTITFPISLCKSVQMNAIVFRRWPLVEFICKTNNMHI